MVEKCRCGVCDTCCQRTFATFLKMIVEDQSLPELSAKSWVVWKNISGKYVYIYGRRPYKHREIASLTKMMVALLILEKLKKWKIDASKIRCAVPINCAGLSGTSANLEAGKVVSVLDLLYGLMLPSGNDAAVLLS
jgi:D-alanyl-D-alanine carboxypeptidase